MSNPRAFNRPADSVTSTKWKGPDGRVWERTGEKRQPLPGEFIWEDTTNPEPYMKTFNGFSGDTANPCLNCSRLLEAHLVGLRDPRDDVWLPAMCPGTATPIWKLSEDQSWEPEPPKPVEIPETRNVVDRGLYEVEYIESPLELQRWSVTAQLHTLKLLERQAAALERLVSLKESRPSLPVVGAAEWAKNEIRQDLKMFPYLSAGWVCPMCLTGEHTRCALVAYDGRCNCSQCNDAPNEGYYMQRVHPFAGEGYRCSLCGGGRLHPVHQG